MHDQVTAEPTLQEIARRLEAALMCLDEGNQARAAQIIYELLAKLPKQ